MCIGEKRNKKINDLLHKIETMSQQEKEKKKKTHTTEPLRSQEGFLEKVIPELSL